MNVDDTAVFTAADFYVVNQCVDRQAIQFMYILELPDNIKLTVCAAYLRGDIVYLFLIVCYIQLQRSLACFAILG